MSVVGLFEVLEVHPEVLEVIVIKRLKRKMLEMFEIGDVVGD